MKILVTGGAGYIGCVLTPLLLENGYHVKVLDNLMYNGTGLLPHFRNPSFEFVKGDVRDPQMVNDAIQDCDVVVHLAAIVGFPACRKHPDLAQTVNVDGTKVIAKSAGRKRLVLYASTGSNYGALEDEVCTEETPLNPLSLYAKTKAAAEQHLLENCSTVAYRFATAFGISPRMRLDLLINDFVYAAVMDKHLVVYEPSFMRSFIHVYDIARSFLFAIENADQMRNEVFNVGDEEMNFSKAQVCGLIQNKVDFYLHYADFGEDEDKRNYVVSYEKIRSLNYRTTISLEEGIDELVHGLQVIDIQNPWLNV